MKTMLFRVMIFAFLVLFGAGVLYVDAKEKPVVSILKAPDHELVAESWMMNWGRSISQGVNKTRKIDYFRAEWNKESEMEIETLVRDAV